MGWWFQVIWYSWDELTPPTSDAKKTHPPKQMVCIRICFVCTCMYICAYVDVRRCASIFWNPPHKGRPYGFDMFWQCCKLSRIWQEKYQCGEEYSKHAEVRMSRISLSVCSLQTALMLNWGIGVLSYLLLHPGRLRNLGSRGVTCQGFRPWKAIQLWFFSLVGLTSILSSEKTHSAGKESMAG